MSAFGAGFQIGGYTIEAEIGRGGGGVVYRARAAGGQAVAVKVLRRSQDPHAAARFAREAKLLEALGEGQGFVPLLGSGNSPLGPWIVMPYMGFGTLRERIKNGALPLDDSLEIVTALAEAVAAAHELGIVHRDLKPENVLFDHLGRPLVTDLGLAKFFGEDSDHGAGALSKTGELRGTLGYMAPEQVSDTKSVGPAADVFALGAILHECLAGHIPFAGTTGLEVLARVTEGSFESLARARPGTPSWVVALVARCLSPDPADRPADARELARALADGRTPARRPRGCALGVVVAVVVAAVAVVAGLGLGGARPVTAPTPSPPPVVGGAPTPNKPQKPPPVSREAQACLDRAAELAQRGALAESLRECERAAELAPGDPGVLASLAGARLSAGKGEGARELLDRALETDPDCFRALWKRAELRASVRDRAGATSDLERAARVEPDKAEVWSALAQALVSSGREREARAAADKALSLDPKDVRAWGARALARIGAEPEGALGDAEKAVALGPRSSLGYNVRSFVRQALGQHEGAIEDATIAINGDPSEGSAYLSRGRAHVALGNLALAMQDFKTGAARDPRDVRLLNDLVKIELDRDPALALLTAEKAVALAPNDALTVALRGAAHRAAGNQGRAMEDAVHALQLDPRSAKGRRLMALLHGDARRFEAARACADEYVALEPRSPEALCLRGNVRFVAGDPRGALEDAEAALELGPQAWEPWLLRAKLRYALDRPGDREGALADARRATELAPANFETWALIGAVRIRNGEWATALTDLDRAVELSPNDFVALFHRSEARERLGDLEGALADLERSVALLPRGFKPATADAQRERLRRLRARSEKQKGAGEPR